MFIHSTRNDVKIAGLDTYRKYQGILMDPGSRKEPLLGLVRSFGSEVPGYSVLGTTRDLQIVRRSSSLLG